MGGDEGALAAGGVVGDGWGSVQPASAISSADSPNIPKPDGALFFRHESSSQSPLWPCAVLRVAW